MCFVFVFVGCLLGHDEAIDIPDGEWCCFVKDVVYDYCACCDGASVSCSDERSDHDEFVRLVAWWVAL